MGAQTLNRILAASGLTILFLAALDPMRVLEFTHHFIFQARDLERARELLAGHPIFFGPEMTGGGNLPGPLYYLMLSLGLAISPAWESAWFLMISMTVLAAFVGWTFLRTQVSFLAAMFFVLLFATSNNTQRLLRVFLNVSFIFPFLLLATVGTLLALGSKNPKMRFWGAISAGFFSAFSIQLHFSAVLPFVTLVFVQPFVKKLKVEGLKPSEIGLSVLVFALPLLANLLGQASVDMGWIANAQERFYAGEASSAFPSLIHLTNFATYDFQFFIGIMSKLLESFAWPALALLLAAYVTDEKLEIPGRQWLRPLLICAAAGFLPFSYWFISTIGIRYGSPFHISITLLSALLLAAIPRQGKSLTVYNSILAVSWMGVIVWLLLWDDYQLTDQYFAMFLICLVGVGMVIFKNRHEYSKTYLASLALTVLLCSIQREAVHSTYLYAEVKTMPSQAMWTKIWEEVYDKTGWDFESSKDRIYYLNHHLEHFGRPAFEKILRETKRVPDRPNQIDGFIVSAFPDRFMKNTKTALNWILRQNIPLEIREGLKTGNIELGVPATLSFLVVPYRVKDPQKMAKHFHNGAEGYIRSDASRQLDEIQGAQGTSYRKDGAYVFKWNSCPSQPNYCNVGGVVRLEGKGPNYNLNVEIVGSPLSQMSPWISPSWTLSWSKPYVSIKCGADTKTMEIAESVGYHRRNAARGPQILLYGNNSILAPVRRSFDVFCASKISELKLGFQGAEVERIFEVGALPAAELGIALNELGRTN